jgi:hypothetical protein
MIRALFYSSRSKSVHWVIVNGQVVLEKGSFVTVDERSFLKECNRASISLLDRMGLKPEPNRLARLPRKTA